MNKIKIGQWFVFKNSKIIYEITFINYVDNICTFVSVNKNHKQFNNFSFPISYFKEIILLGDPRIDKSLRILYD